MAKHRYADVLKNCKNHGVNTYQDIRDDPIRCFNCKREVK